MAVLAALARPPRRLRAWLAVVALAVAVVYLVRVVEPAALGAALHAVADRPAALGGALVLYAAAFALRAWAWCRVLPALPYGQSWAALHVSLLGNHLLPFRLGEALRVTSVLRRTDLPAAPVTASAVALRGADLLAVLVLVAAAAVGWLARLRRGGAAVRLPGPAVALAAAGAWLLEAAVLWAAA